MYYEKEVIYYQGIEWKRHSKIIQTLEKCFFPRLKFILCTGDHLKQRLNKISATVELTKPILKTSSFSVSNVETESLKIISVGAISNRKNQDILVEAGKRLMTKEIDFNITLVGQGDIQNFKKRHADSLSQLGDRFVLKGHISDVEELKTLYSIHAVLCITSYEEGFPRVAYEAWLSGLLIVSSDLDCFQDSRFENHLVKYSPNTVDALTDILVQISLQGERYDIIRRSGMKYCQNLLNETPTEQFIRLYEAKNNFM